MTGTIPQVLLALDLAHSYSLIISADVSRAVTANIPCSGPSLWKEEVHPCSPTRHDGRIIPEQISVQEFSCTPWGLPRTLHRPLLPGERQKCPNPTPPPPKNHRENQAQKRPNTAKNAASTKCRFMGHAWTVKNIVKNSVLEGRRCNVQFAFFFFSQAYNA